MSSKPPCDKTRLCGDLGLRCQGPRDMCVCVCACVCVHFRLFQTPLPIMPLSVCSLCGSLIRQWAGLRPCLKGRSPGLLAEHLLKDHSSGYIWGGLLSSHWSLPPSFPPFVGLSVCLSVFISLNPFLATTRALRCHFVILSPLPVCPPSPLPSPAPSLLTHPSPCLNINRPGSVTPEGHWFCFVALRNPLERQ